MIKRITKAIKERLKLILIILIIMSLVEFLYVLIYGNVVDEVRERLPLLFIGTIISESLFLIGVGTMAYAIEHEVGWNPLKWRRHLKDLLNKVPDSRVFWIGFWINAAGAFMTGAVWLAAIIFGLPLSAWGIIWLPISDIFLTIALRMSILELKRQKPVVQQSIT